jgi:hypothetical protein
MDDIDYIIVGSGPTGLALAWLLSKYNNKIMIIEQNNEIGGAHRVKRVNGLFTEHSPRIYSNNYKVLRTLLDDMNIDFYELFSLYKFQSESIIKIVFKYLSLYELFTMAITFIGLNDSYKNITMEEYTTNKNFSNDAKFFIDRICRMLEGSDMTRYTLYQFMEYINSTILYKIYQPNKPMDRGLLKLWKDKLEGNGVKFMMNSKVVNILPEGKNIKNLVIKNNDKNLLVKAKNYILAIPPTSMVNLLRYSNVPNAFGNFSKISQWESNVKYNDYISVIFHWDTEIKVKSIWGFPYGPWGIISVISTDYIDFQDPRSKFVISTCISIQDQEYNGKKAQDCTKSEIIDLAFKQLQELYPSLPNPSYSLMEHNVYRNNRWVATTDGYLSTKYGGIDFKSNYDNLYTCGTHNDKSDYASTTMESSMDNAMKLAHQLVPQSKNDYKVEKNVKLLNVIYIVSFISLFTIFIRKLKKN